jgi:hypothetical protein
MIDRDGHQGGYLVVFPEYRPDQFQALADQLGVEIFDYRTQVMAQQGPAADRISLSDLDTALERLARQGAYVTTNVEALLATKSSQERSHWLARFLETVRSHALIIPLVTLTEDLPDAHPRLYSIPNDALPAQSLLNRLAF